jgi:PST family polysaccharide transporter
MNRKNTIPRLRSNIAALGAVQISNYIIPLITIPYLTRVLEAEAFGKVTFAQVVMTYFVLLVDYGFSWSATRKVSAQRADRDALSRTFAATWAAQWLLVIVAALVATTAVLLTDRLRPDALLYAAAFSTVIGTALFPIWFLQGLERLQVVAALQLITRTLALIPIFLFIHQPQDAVWVLLIQGSGVILGGVLALYWMRRESLITWRLPSWADTLGALREGGALFGSRAAISLYTTLVPLVLGWVTGPAALAYFNLADKLRSAAQSLLSPLSQALFPRMNHLVQSNGHAAYALIQRSALGVLIVAGSASMAVWFLADWLVLLLGGRDFLPAVEVLRWLAPLPLVITLSNILGVQIMLPHGLNRAFNAILISAAAASLVLIGPMSSHFQAVGAAQTILAVEIWVTGAMAVFLWRQGYFRPQRWVAKRITL